MRIDVPQEMARCVEQLGGIVLDKVLVRPAFFNADYWFPEHLVIAELKCLTEDLSAKAEFNDSTDKLYASWVKRGDVPPLSGRRLINLQDLPVRCAREFLEPIKKRLEASTIKKANRQIRETKRHLGEPQAKGLLVLVNDGNYMLPPSMMNHLLARILKGKHSNINSVIYTAINEPSFVPDIEMPSLFWIDTVVPERVPVSLEFRNDFKAAWIRHHSDAIGAPILEITSRKDSAFIDQIQFNRRST